MTDQPGLFDLPPDVPDGFRYQACAITPAEEDQLIADLSGLPFKPFEFHGHTGHREVISFGWRYDYARQAIDPVAPIPQFLLPVRARLEGLSRHTPEAFQQILINRYGPGAGIGWHRDKRQFGDVMGLSLGAPCRLRFRKADGSGWRRLAVDVAPRSLYLLSGPARSDWEHSIASHEALRYSITFRTLA